MEYLYYDYANTKTDITFSNYEKFITNGKIYKYYLFDLFLMRYDSNQPKDKVEKAYKYVAIQKILFLLPHFVNISFISYLYYKGLFEEQNFHSEKRIFKRLFFFYILCRISQKALLKYQVDDIITIQVKNKNK